MAAPGEETPGSSGTAITVRPFRSEALYRTGYPDDRNDGALWSGRGASALVEGGVEGRLGILSAAIVPTVTFQQNAEFETIRSSYAGLSMFVYPWSADIDYPQRFGDRSFWTFHPGQSYVRADAYGVAAGISTENLWWGPAIRYPILMSNTAPGMPHLFAGTSGPLDVRIGDLDLEFVWARATESGFYDEVPENDHSMLAGLVVAFSPRPLPGLWLGAARAYQYRDDGWGDPGAASAVFSLGGSNQPGNELASLFGRWMFPESGAEVYAEWAREDAFNDFDELLQEPDHSQAYMMGFQKVTPVGDALSIRVHGELVALQEQGELRSGSRPRPTYYTHNVVFQGYTHRGQVLGAGIGPGGDAQFVGADALGPWGVAGLFIERVRRADAARPAIDMRRSSPYLHDTEIVTGLRSTYFLRPGLSVAGRLAYSFRYNRDFLEDDTNWTLGLGAAWAPTDGWPLR